MKKQIIAAFDRVLGLSKRFSDVKNDIEKLSNVISSTHSSMLNILDALKMHQNAISELLIFQSQVKNLLERSSATELKVTTTNEKKAQKPN